MKSITTTILQSRQGRLVVAHHVSGGKGDISRSQSPSGATEKFTFVFRLKQIFVDSQITKAEV